MTDSITKDILKKYTVRLDPPIFTKLMAPEGFLTQDKECHALWHYYIYCAKMLEQKDKLVYEGQADFVIDKKKNAENLFKATCILYGTDPERMKHFWVNVDMQAVVMGFTKLPEEFRWRKVANIITETKH